MDYLLERLFASHPATLEEAEAGPDENGDYFRLVFQGRTPVLRDFLNSLAQERLPLLAREINVSTLSAGEKRRRQSPFDAFNGQPVVNPDQPSQTPVPLVQNNLSRFEVVIDCPRMEEAP